MQTLRINYPSVLICLALMGCAQMNSVHRELTIDEGKGALIDIKQRGIFVSKENAGPSENRKVLVCAEPSPDSLSAYAAELAGKYSLPNGTSAQLSSAFQESASFVGLRTNTIQLLRDMRYRDCEAYMNGALDAASYELQVRRHQKPTVALLAIEQLTGALRAPTVGINTNGSAITGYSVEELQKGIDSTNAKITDLKQQKKAAKNDVDKTKQLNAQIEGQQANLDALKKAIKNGRTALAAGEANVAVSNIGLQAQASDARIQAVTQAVTDIAKSVLAIEDQGQLCFNYLKSFKSEEKNTPLVDHCKKMLSDPSTHFQLQSLNNQ